MTKLGRVPVVTGRGGLQDTADRLAPETVTMLIDKCPQDLVRRRKACPSGSAWAKYALARHRRISLAVRSSRFSRSRALMRSRSSLLAQHVGRRRSVGDESSHAGFALHSQSSGQRFNGRPLGRGVVQVLQNHAHGTLTDFRGVGRGLSHGLIFSRVEASTNPGRFSIYETRGDSMLRT